MNDSLLNAVGVIEAEYAAHRKRVMDAHGLSAIEVDVLIFLATHPDLKTAADITEKLRVSKSHVSLAANHLAEMGLLSRRPDERNRKRIFLDLTDASKVIVDDALDEITALKKELYKGLTKREKDNLSAIIEKVEENADQAWQKRKHN